MSEGSVSIELLHKLPTPFNDLLFRALAARDGVRLQVHHLWERRENRPWAVQLAKGYPNRFMRPIFGLDFVFLRRAALQGNSLFIIGDWGHSPAISALLLRVVMRKPVSVWADTPQEQLPRPFFRRTLRRVFLRWLLPRLDLVFATGRPGVDAVVAMGVKRERAVDLPCFTDLNSPAEWMENEKLQDESRNLRVRVGCGGRGTVFLMSGQLTKKKGQDVGVEALRNVLKSATTPVGLLIAGDGPERNRLQDLACRLGVDDSVVFLGWLDPEEMLAAYGAADSLLHLSRYEPYGLAVLEAMAWGLPVVGTDVCGAVQDRIHNEENGLTVAVDDVEATSAAMMRLVESPTFAIELGKNARATAIQWPVRRGVDTIVMATRRVLTEHSNSK